MVVLNSYRAPRLAAYRTEHAVACAMRAVAEVLAKAGRDMEALALLRDSVEHQRKADTIRRNGFICPISGRWLH